MTGRQWTGSAGILLMAIAVFGVVTVADDLRHVGELVGVASVFVAGASLAASASVKLSFGFALQWVAVGLGMGLLLGVAADLVPAGAAAGLAFGLFTAYSRRRKAGMPTARRQVP